MTTLQELLTENPKLYTNPKPHILADAPVGKHESPQCSYTLPDSFCCIVLDSSRLGP